MLRMNDSFVISATDGHPTQPLTKNRLITVNVETYNADCMCAGEFAENSLSLSSNIRTGHYTALEYLDSDASIFSSSDVLFKAGETISLNSGFYVPPSSNFNAFIANCRQPALPEKQSP